MPDTLMAQKCSSCDDCSGRLCGFAPGAAREAGLRVGVSGMFPSYQPKWSEVAPSACATWRIGTSGSRMAIARREAARPLGSCSHLMALA